LQPKPHTASGYCYYGRLRSFCRSIIPATHGVPVRLVTDGPSCCPFVPGLRRDFPGRSVFQAPVCISRRSCCRFQRLSDRSLLFSEAL
jgi:hypothetical protein